jgi:membrane associated rhomboid family serine protease
MPRRCDTIGTMRLSGRKYSSYTRHWTQRQRIVLLAIIGANLAAFCVQLTVEAYQPGFVSDYLGLSDAGVHQAYAWQFITAMFLHDGPWHLLGNMLILYLLGRDLESILGQRHFLYLYLAGGTAGELGHLFLMPSDSVLFAASGGVAAVVMAYATILPELELTAVRFFAFPIRLKAKHIAYGAFVLAVILVCIDRDRTVCHSAYLGGCVAGWLYAHLLGFGRPSLLQRFLRQQRIEAERYDQMSVEQLMAGEIDPLLEKISRYGLPSLTRKERRSLSKAREKILQKAESK